MNTPDGSSRSAIPAWKWGVVVMMLLATVINYMDRAALGNLSSFIKNDFHLKEEGYGKLEEVFGYSYAVFLVVAGFLADRWSLRWLYAGALLVWSLAGFATGFVTTILELQICRAMLGAGEAFNWPVAVGTVRRIMPRESQSFANGVFNSGMTIGAVLTPVLVLLMVNEKTGEGWRSLFKIVGALGSLWVVFWLLCTRGGRAREMTPEGTATAETIPFVDVFSLRTFWITMAVGIAVNLAWHLYRVWLPRHLVVDLKFTDKELQYLLMGYYLVADLGSIAFGFIARRVITPARPVERARKLVVLIAACVCLAALPALFTPGRWIMYPLYCMVGAGIMGVFAMFYSFVQDIVPGHTSKCLGLIGATVWFIVSRLHPLIGRFADTHAPAIGKFVPMLLAAGALPLLAALFALTWPEKREPAAAS
ncbi:MAG: MFS transporter [Planctomycetes bacterium]|nr:MFS transporter [Planctomycetota bacterium]